MPSAIEHMLLPSGMTQQQAPHKLVGSRVVRDLPPLNKSLVANKEKLLLDMGLFHSRGCRVGWAPSLSIVHTGDPIAADPGTV